MLGNQGLVSLFISYYVLASCKKLEKYNEQILRYRAKCLLWAQICIIYPDFGKKRIFGNQVLVSLVISYYVLASCKKIEKYNERILRYRAKCLFWAQICIIYPDFGKKRIFGNQGLVSLVISYYVLASCKKLEKYNEWILRYRAKCLFWAQTCLACPKQEFSKCRSSVIFYLLLCISFMQKTRKI